MGAHTHHHRDQCQGDHLLESRAAVPIAVPEREAALFAETDAFWRHQAHLRQLRHVSSIGFTLPRPVKVARMLRDYETFAWRGYDIRVLPTPGHTKGSVTFAAEIDGVATAFCGDLIADPGHVHSIHDLQWQYGLPDAAGAALHSVTLLAGLPLQRLCPSHGHPTDDAGAAIRLLRAEAPRALRAPGRDAEESGLAGLAAFGGPAQGPRPAPCLGESRTRWPTATRSWPDDGRALLLDYGFPSWDHMAADLRFVEHSLDDLKAVAGLRAVDVVIPSHYHDDHLAGLPWLQQTQGTKAWIFENFAEIVSNPAGYNVPCLLPHSHPRRPRSSPTAAASRGTAGRSTSSTCPATPGGRWDLFGVIDGTRVAFTGDNLLQGTVSSLRAAAPVYRNKMLADSIAVGVRRLMEFEPELILTGHTGRSASTGRCSRTFTAGPASWRVCSRPLVAVPAEVNFALDPNFATLYPYRNPRPRGDRLSLELRVTNHGTREAVARASLVAPPGWSVAPGEATPPHRRRGDGHAPVRGRGGAGRRGPPGDLRRAVPRRAAFRSDRRGAGRRGLGVKARLPSPADLPSLHT